MTRRHALTTLLLIGFSAALGHALVAGDPWKTTARYRFEYHVSLAPLAADAGKSVRLWIPFPAENRAQKLLSSDVQSPWAWRRTQEKKLGNRMIYTEGKLAAEPGEVVLRIEVERDPSAGVPLGAKPFEGALSPALYRGPDRMVPLTGVIQKIAAEESGALGSEAEKVQALYDYVYRTMTYNKDGTGWGRGDAIWACDNKRGNCTDFHSLFIAMLRSQGIPARFLIGFPIPDGAEGTIGGYHCWAEFFDKSRGWLPVDASEAKKKGWKEAYFGVLPNDRIEFTAGRDLVLEPSQKGEPLNFFIYPYAEVDGAPRTDLKGEFRFQRVEERSL